jgi:hypothetical protein
MNEYSPRRGPIAETIARSLRFTRGHAGFAKPTTSTLHQPPGSREVVAMISDAVPSPAVSFFGRSRLGRQISICGKLDERIRYVYRSFVIEKFIMNRLSSNASSATLDVPAPG